MKIEIKPFYVETFESSGQRFSEIRGRRVLFYWPHGFGDWVFLSYICRFFDVSNKYYITRFGDDNVALFDGCEYITPLYTGINSTHCGDGEAFGIRHFGLEDRYKQSGALLLPETLHRACVRNKIDLVVHTPLWESHGSFPFPYHSKIRSLAKTWISDDRHSVLNDPLKSVVSFTVDGFVQRLVERRLQTWMGLKGKRLCLISRNGYTSVGKNWGHLWRDDLPVDKRREGEEARDFMRLMQKRDPKWIFLVMEDRLFEGFNTLRNREAACWSYAEIFGSPDTSFIPFGLILKAILNVADLMVGVPAGPYHLAMAMPGMPTIGLWTEHFPSWYDEPKAESIHLLSRNLRDEGISTRIGSIRAIGETGFQCWDLDDRVIPGEVVMSAAEHLLGQSPVSRGKLTVRASTIPGIETRKKRILIAICSCHARKSKRENVRQSWLKLNADAADCVFFVGKGSMEGEEDVIVLDVEDSYEALPLKVHAMFNAVLKKFEFDYLFKCDDDTYVALDRLHSLIKNGADLVGDITLNSGWPCGGAGYLITHRTVELLASEQKPAHGAEDVWVGKRGRALGLEMIPDGRLNENCNAFPRRDNDIITAHRCRQDVMGAIHSIYSSESRLETWRAFDALHWEWKGKVALLLNGIFLGGVAAPHGRWKLLGSGDVLLLEWFHWKGQYLLQTDWGYFSKVIQLVYDHPEARRMHRETKASEKDVLVGMLAEKCQRYQADAITGGQTSAALSKKIQQA